jgi:RNA polymerase sigma-70 factor (ECF subfamily)
MAEMEQDRALLERIRAGDMSACDECVRQHAEGVYRLALRLTRNEAEAEDVMQDAFLSAFKGIDKFDGRSSLRTWLYRIAYNAAVMRLRRRKPVHVSLDEAADPQDQSMMPQAFYDWSSLPNRELEKEEVREEMERAIGELPPKLRAVFVMRELEDLSTEETARALEVTEEAVKTRLHRARLWLRERLTAYFAPRPPQGTGVNP